MALSMGILMALSGMVLLTLAKVYDKKTVDAAGLFTGAFYLYLLRVALLGLIVLFTSQFILPPDLPYYFLTVIIGAIAIVALYLAFQKIGIGLPSAIAGSFVPLTILLSILFYGETFSGITWVGIVLVVVGIFLAAFDINHTKLKMIPGTQYAFITLVGWGLFFFLIKRIIVPMGTIPATFAIEAGVFLVVACFALWKNALQPIRPTAWRTAGVSAITSAIGLILYYGSVPLIGAALAATILQVAVVLSAIFGAFFFKESFTLLKKVAILITFLGLVLVTL